MSTERITYEASLGLYTNIPDLFAFRALQLHRQEQGHSTTRELPAETQSLSPEALEFYDEATFDLDSIDSTAMSEAFAYTYGALEAAGAESLKAENDRIFEKGLRAFFPAGIDFVDAQYIKGLYDESRTLLFPTTHEDIRAKALEARAVLLEIFTGKKYAEEFYKGISVERMFETANWLYGGTHAEYTERGWSVDPATIFTLNPLLAKYDYSQLETAVTMLVEAAGISHSQALTKAARVLYKVISNPQEVRDELQELHDMGILKHVVKRPDILNYPSYVLKHKEREYVRMGIPLEVVVSEAKFYAYNPKRIAERLAAFEEIIENAEPFLDPEDADILKYEILTQPRILIDCGLPKIKKIADLIKRYAKPNDWQAAKASASKQVKTPQTSLVMSLARVGAEKLEKYMQDGLSDNIFEAARSIVSDGKKETRLAKLALESTGETFLDS